MKSGQLRRAMAAGIASVVLFVAGVFLNFGDTPNIKSSDTNAAAAQKWVTELSGSGHRAGLIVSAYLLILAGLASYGAVRLWQHPTAYVSGVKLRIMQPNLQQDEKFNYAAKASVMRRYLRLSDRATDPQSNGVGDVTHLIWPESAFPFFLTREPDALGQIADLLSPGTVLITGAIRAAQLRR